MSDAELIHQYASDKSDAAFRELVDRYLPLVYSAALRQVGDPAQAEDLTQVVFIILARKAGALSPKTILPGWLFRTTRHAAAKALRTEHRRRRRELEAFQMQSAQSNDVWEQVAPLLDDALAQLSESDRNAVLLHYFQNKRLRDVGLAFGLSEDTMQKRLARAIGKLRKIMVKHGVALPVVAIPGLLFTHAAQAAPSYLCADVAAAALSQAAMSTSVYALLQEALIESLWPKVATVAAWVAGLVIVSGLVVYFWPKSMQRGDPGYSFESKIAMRQPYVAAREVETSPIDKPGGPRPAEQLTLMGPIAEPTAVVPPPPSVWSNLVLDFPTAGRTESQGGAVADSSAASGGPTVSGSSPPSALAFRPVAYRGGYSFQYRFLPTGEAPPIFYTNYPAWLPVQPGITVRILGNPPNVHRKK